VAAVAELLEPVAAVVAVSVVDEVAGVVDLSVLGLAVLVFAPFFGLFDGAVFNCQLTSS
jgi:hypothetical protein